MKVVNVRADRYVKGVDAADFGRAADVLVVQVDTDGGVSGVGITALFVPRTGEVVDLYARLITKNYRQILVGENALATEELWNKMYRESAVWGRTGIGRQCLSVLDLALWDLKSKLAGVPLWQLLGGALVDRVPAYANTAHDLPPERLAEQADRYVARGFRAVKIRGSAGVVTPEEATRRVAAVREAIGPDVRLMVDVNGTWDAETAVLMLRQWAEFDLYWLEEPVPRDDVAGYVRVRRIARELGVNIAGGEQLETLREMQTFLEHDALDILQPTPTFVGGVTEMIRIAGLAERFAVPVAPHGVQHVSLHLVAALPGMLCVEVFQPDNPLREFALALIQGPREAVEIDNGTLRLPTADGIGYQLDKVFADEFRMD
jgi:L-alanine-DL-glutamate epimerase-like enolase superfamily enzyme